MASSRKGGVTDLWAEIVADEDRERPPKDRIAVVYGRRRTDDKNPSVVQIERNRSRYSGGNRVSFAPTKRPSWNRSLSIRGRESIIVSGELDCRPHPLQRGVQKRPPRAKKRGQVQPDLKKEKAYFQEVDSFELVEESPSPKNFSWAMGTKHDYIVHDLPSILERWKLSKIAYSCRTSHPLYKIMETPMILSAQSSCGDDESSIEKTPEKCSVWRGLSKFTSHDKSSSLSGDENSIVILTENSVLSSFGALQIKDEDVTTDNHEGIDMGPNEVLEGAIRKAPLPVRPKSFSGECLSAFKQLLMVCRQSTPVKLSEVFSAYCEPNSIVKIGEGTYGEAFRVGETVCKVVPIDGDSPVNGEIQKKSEEVLEEVLLSLTLNSLKGQEGETQSQNICTSFIETKDFRVCRGRYDPSLIRAWEDWDTKHHSANDHPGEFSEEQLYIVFVLADGGKDLESFVLLNFNEAQSLLVQVAFALAVAEAACEFEHRDLHWGNILLSRNEATAINFILEGKEWSAKTFGLTVSIIDFTLSRINTGEAILFLDLSADPALFEGPKREIQFETYRRMKEVTEECWEDSFPRTNVLWLIYLVEVLLTKKSYKRNPKDQRELRSFKRRLDSYDSAKDSLSDSFFSGLLEENVGSCSTDAHPLTQICEP